MKVNEDVPTLPVSTEPIIGSEGATPRPKGSLLDLINKYGSAESGEAEFDVVLPKGDSIRCLRVFDRVRILQLREASYAWANEMAALNPEQLPEQYRRFHTNDVNVLVEAWLVSRLCKHPDLHNQEMNALVFARSAGAAHEAIINQINLASANLLAIDRKTFESEGNA